MRAALPLTFSLLLCGVSVLVACSSDDDPEPGFTQTGHNGSSGAAGASGAAGGANGQNGQGGGAGASRAGQGGSGGGSQGGGGAGGKGGSGGQGGFCGDDPNEPNDSPLQATTLIGGDGDDIMSDCDDFEESQAGLLEGPDDEDWFVFKGKDENLCGIFGSSMQPQVKLELPLPAEVCIFVRPNSNTTDGVECAEGGGSPSDELTEAGFAGCCGPTSARTIVSGSLGPDDGAEMRIKVSKLSGAVCGAFEVKYSFIDP